MRFSKWVFAGLVCTALVLDFGSEEELRGFHVGKLDYLFKLLLIGDSGVGKSCLLLRFAGKKGIWLKLSVKRAELVTVAIKEGFQYHHAERGYAMLTYWIPEGPCMLLANASHPITPL